MTCGFWRAGVGQPLWGLQPAQQFSAPLGVALSDSFLTALPFLPLLFPSQTEKKAEFPLGPSQMDDFDWEVQGSPQQGTLSLGPRLSDFSALGSGFSLPGIRKSCREVIISFGVLPLTRIECEERTILPLDWKAQSHCS